VTSTARGRAVALTLGLLVVFGALGFEAAHHAPASNSSTSESSFFEAQVAAVAPAEVVPAQSGLNRSPHPPALAFFLTVGCALAASVRRPRVSDRSSRRRRLDRFFVLRRGPPTALLVR
jgi:hypothetical protein